MLYIGMFTLVAMMCLSNSVVLSEIETRGYKICKSIKFINNNQTLWRAKCNFNAETPFSYIKNIMGTVITRSEVKKTPEVIPEWNNTSFPHNLDARYRWPYCKSLKEVRNQGGCGSSWAIGVASVLTDRICILTNGIQITYFSEEDILTCCKNCLGLTKPIKSPCTGGYLDKAWEYVKNGIVSGGSYQTIGGCKSYKALPINFNFSTKDTMITKKRYSKAKCVHNCDTNSRIHYFNDRRKFRHVYRVHKPMSEILQFGPITAIMEVYEDFISYESGVYRRIKGNFRFIGYHTVKILGWGLDSRSQTKYWLAANSWGSQWGDNGFFKIVRGENHCKIEQLMMAGKFKK